MHKRIHLLTWHSPDTFHQIDHCLINGWYFSDVIYVRARRGANIDSDHMSTHQHTNRDVSQSTDLRIGTSHHGSTTSSRLNSEAWMKNVKNWKKQSESSDKHHRLQWNGLTRSVQRGTSKRTPPQSKPIQIKFRGANIAYKLARTKERRLFRKKQGSSTMRL
jgi:hypothetical protein